MQIKFDPSAEDETHSIEIPAMVIEGRDQCDKIVASLQKRAAVLWPKLRQPRKKAELSAHGFSPTQAPPHKPQPKK